MSAAGDHYFTPSPEAPAQRRPLTVSLAGRPRSLQTASGVFSADRLDAGTRVVFGATVTLADVETDEERRYQIVGDLEADIKRAMIAI